MISVIKITLSTEMPLGWDDKEGKRLIAGTGLEGSNEEGPRRRENDLIQTMK